MEENFAKSFLGTGWKFPIQVDEATGRIMTSRYEEDIQEAIRIIVMTGKGERVMRPDFGCGLREYLFQGLDYETVTQMRGEIEEALTGWEPRIADVEVDVIPDDGKMLIHVSYVVRSTNNPFNLIFPYYLTEGTE
ncbi:MAG TPA: GPW/gp25 family protein [Bacillota bacterium]|nr:GPW/gp25 family protein [Bacillota bacterium]